MKVLHIWNSVSSPVLGGSGSHSHNTFLRQAFRNNGHEVVPFEPGTGAGDTAAGMQKHRSAYRRLKAMLPSKASEWLRDLYSLMYDFKATKAIGATIDREQPDFVYERYSDYHLSGWKAAASRGLPYILEIHDPPEARAYFARRANFELYNRWVQRRITSNADSMVVVSSYLKQFLVKGGVPEDKVLMLPNGVNLDLFQPTEERENLRKRLGFSDSLVVGFVGSMKAYHGLDLMLQLCRLIEKTRKDIRYLVVGSFKAYPGGEEALREELRGMGIEDRFALTGGLPVEQVPVHVDAMDICIMPDSNHFGSPIKLFEYGALAKACVFPRYTPVEDVMEHDVNGLIFEPKNVDDMAAQVLKLAQDEKLRDRLGRQLRQDVVENHTWEKNAEKVVARVEQIIANRGKQP